ASPPTENSLPSRARRTHSLTMASSSTTRTMTFPFAASPLSSAASVRRTDRTSNLAFRLSRMPPHPGASVDRPANAGSGIRVRCGFERLLGRHYEQALESGLDDADRRVEVSVIGLAPSTLGEGPGGRPHPLGTGVGAASASDLPAVTSVGLA